MVRAGGIVDSPMRTKVLIVGGFPHEDSEVYGGVVTVCRELTQSKFSSEFDLELVDSTQRSNPPPGLAVRSVWAVIRCFRFTIKLISCRPAVVVLFVATGGSVLEKGLMSALGALAGSKVMVFPRGAELIEQALSSKSNFLWIGACLKAADYLLCQGDSWHRFAVQRLGFEASKAPIIHNWTVNSDILDSGKRRQKRSSGESTRILFVGWVEKEKGIKELIEAVRILSADLEVDLTIAGHGNYYEPAKRMVMDYDLNSRVHFTGWVDSRRRTELLMNTDIFVLPSWAEGFPNSVIEAMAAKTAVVVSSVGIVPDILKNEVDAVLVEPKNSYQLAAAMRKLIEDEALLNQIAHRGYMTAVSAFNKEKNIEKLSSIIRSAASRTG